MTALPVVTACIGFVLPGIFIGDGLPMPLSRTLAVAYGVLSIALQIMIYRWCQADVSERQASYPAGLPILVGAFFPLGLPIYFLATRSAFKALVHLAIAGLYMVVCLCFFVAGGYLFLRLFA